MKAVNKKPTIETIDASLARWKTRLKRAMTAIGKLEKQRKRLVKAASSPPKPTPVPAAKPEPLAVKILREMAAPDPTPVKAAEIDTEIPAFLRRQPKLDPVAAGIKAEQDETKRRKAVGRIAKLKAKKSGATRKLPLSGRAALEAIRNSQ